MVAALVGGIAVVGLATVAYAWSQRDDGQGADIDDIGAAAATCAVQLVSTAGTANMGMIGIPEVQREQLVAFGEAHDCAVAYRVQADGNVEARVFDLTAYPGGDASKPPLKLAARVREEVLVTIANLEAWLNVGASFGGEALYPGLARIAFADATPVWIYATGMDSSGPVSFMDADWRVPASQIVEGLGKDRAVLNDAPVTFVVTQSVGRQEQLREIHREYVRDVQSVVLFGSGAAKVDFINGLSTTPASTTPADPIPVPDMSAGPTAPPTPDPPRAKPTPSGKDACDPQPADDVFHYGSAKLIDQDRFIGQLDCLTDAVKAGWAVNIDCYASYEGRLTASGQVPRDTAITRYNQKLTDERCAAIRTLLITEFGVAASGIGRVRGHGNNDLPHSDPRDPRNRLVALSFSPPLNTST